ncbi:hypothetical protein A2U01_0038917 [Trifolium medium]|uniref:Uncharacterized protein n=1 Tax=Trifolium medium TaxID=97028 RepID=A0A392Q2H9_9FABA|nr:hypothetical protein [Trifolium medium]
MGFLTIGPTCGFLERLPALLKIDELSAKMDANSVKMDKFLNLQTEIKGILLVLTSKSRPAVTAKGSVNLKSVVDEGREQGNNCEDGGLKRKNQEPSQLKAETDKETLQEMGSNHILCDIKKSDAKVYDNGLCSELKGVELQFLPGTPSNPIPQQLSKPLEIQVPTTNLSLPKKPRYGSAEKTGFETPPSPEPEKAGFEKPR